VVGIDVLRRRSIRPVEIATSVVAGIASGLMFWSVLPGLIVATALICVSLLLSPPSTAAAPDERARRSQRRDRHERVALLTVIGLATLRIVWNSTGLSDFDSKLEPVLLSLLVGGFATAVFSLMTLNDVWCNVLARIVNRPVKRRAPWNISVGGIVAVVSLAATGYTPLPTRLRFELVVRDQVESTMAEVERACRQPSAPHPQYGGRDVQSFACHKNGLSFTAGSRGVSGGTRFGFSQGPRPPVDTEATSLGHGWWLWEESEVSV
jgi:hypothetical protein